MTIHSLSEYRLTASGFVLKTSKAWIAKLAIVVSIIFTAIYPSQVSSTFVQYTPMAKIEEQKIHGAAMKIVSINSKLDEEEAQTIVESSVKWGKKFGIEPSLILGLMLAESTFDKHAISNVGAFGLMQVLPRWHTEKIKVARDTLGQPDPFDIDTNVFLGTWVLKDCMKKYSSVDNGLKCYNGSVGMDTNYHIKVISGKKKFDAFI